MTVSRQAEPTGLSEPDIAAHAVASRGPAALAGLLAVGAAVGASELVAGFLTGAPSLVVAVGDIVIDHVPGSVERAAISVLGRNDKPFLLASILVVCAIFGAALGVLGRRHLGLAAAGFGLFAVLATAAALAEPRSSAPSSVVVGLVAAVVGIGALAILLQAGAPASVAAAADTRSLGAHTGATAVQTDGLNRRSFLFAAVATAAVGVAGAVAGRMLAAREQVSVLRAAVRIPRPTRTAPAAPAGASLDVPGLTPLFISNSNFYRIDTALVVPQVDPSTWSLEVGGRVDRPFTLSYADLMELDQIEVDVTLSCVSNEIGGDLVGNARWQGVPLAALLERAGVQDGADQIVGRSVDGFTAGFPTSIALDGRNAIVAVAMNGEPLPVVHGFPARLVVPGLYGYVSATKWLSAIELTGWEELDGYWIPRGWSKEGPVKTQSRIDVPAANTSIPAGPRAVAGIAWAPHRGISAVQVRVDDGDWQDADLADALGDDTWRQWVYQWDATPGEHTLAVRATDGTGETQTEQRTPVAPDGASGWHTISLLVEA